MGWHIHYSRLGFPNIVWPFFVVTGLGALVEAVRGNDRRYWALTGLLFGLGVYTYNSHVVVLLLTSGYLAFLTFGPPVLLLPRQLDWQRSILACSLPSPSPRRSPRSVTIERLLSRNRMAGLAIFAAFSLPWHCR